VIILDFILYIYIMAQEKINGIKKFEINNISVALTFSF